MTADEGFNSIKDIYFIDLKDTQELYKDFDLKIRVLYVLLKEPYGMSIKQIIHRLGGKYNKDRNKIKEVLISLNGLALTYIICDVKQGIPPSPMMWICDVKKVREVLKAVKSIHTGLGNAGFKKESPELFRLRDGSFIRTVPKYKNITLSRW